MGFNSEYGNELAGGPNYLTKSCEIMYRIAIRTYRNKMPWKLPFRKSSA